MSIAQALAALRGPQSCRFTTGGLTFHLVGRPRRMTVAAVAYLAKRQSKPVKVSSVGADGARIFVEMNPADAAEMIRQSR